MANNTPWALGAVPLIVALLCGWATLDRDRVEQAKGKSSEKLVTAKVGGRIESLSGKAWLVIPPGALQSDTRISIQEASAVADILAVGPSFELKPDGLKFLKPATLTVRFAAKDIPRDYGAEDMVLSGEAIAPQRSAASRAGAEWQAGSGLFFLDTTTAGGQGTASAQLDHLSKYVLRAISSYTLGTEQQLVHGTKKFFNIILADHNVQGQGEALAGTRPDGYFSISVSVPLGQEGMSVGMAVGTKFFRVKPSAKGLKEVQSVIEVEMQHSAHITPETNSYLMKYSVMVGAWLRGRWMWALTGWPRLSARDEYGTPLTIQGQKPGGQFPGTKSSEGLFEQVFFKDPVQKGWFFPLGPEYISGRPAVSFGNCQLVAGRVYGLVIGLNAVVTGARPDPPGVPAKGGDVGLYDGNILRVTIRPQP